jgi:hypothetical protein
VPIPISEVVKAVGSISATAFGIYGIGAKTRKPDRSLTRAGWIALIGLTVSLIVTLTDQYVEANRRVEEAREQAEKFAELVSSAFYAPLTTRDARLDLAFTVKFTDLQAVEPSYAARLKD